MEALTLTSEQKATYIGIRATTESGKAAKLYEDDGAITATTDSTATGEVSNVREYTDAGGNVGTEFDLTIRANGTAGASVVTVSADADAGETRNITLEFNVTANNPEASAFVLPTPVIELA